MVHNLLSQGNVCLKFGREARLSDTSDGALSPGRICLIFLSSETLMCMGSKLHDISGPKEVTKKQLMLIYLTEKDIKHFRPERRKSDLLLQKKSHCARVFLIPTCSVA